jgi:hypothetical protein
MLFPPSKDIGLRWLIHDRTSIPPSKIQKLDVKFKGKGKVVPMLN